MASGIYAGEAAAEALRADDTSAAGLAGYERRLGDTFVLRDHRKLRRAPSLVLSDRVQHLYPEMIANTVERMFRVDNPSPKPGLRRIFEPGTQTRRREAQGSRPRRHRRTAELRMSSRMSARELDGADRTLAGPLLRGPDRLDALRRPRARPHHRRRHHLRRLHHPRMPGGLPGEAVRPDEQRWDPVQLRTVLRVRDVLPRVQQGGCDHLDVPRGRPRRGLCSLVTARS